MDMMEKGQIITDLIEEEDRRYQQQRNFHEVNIEGPPIMEEGVRLAMVSLQGQI